MNNSPRILIVRTDRIGDVVLSTPVFAAVRGAYPGAHIAAMVSPAARDIVEGNPCVNEVLVYDKDDEHRHWLDTVRFSWSLRRRRFDTALILHPANRAHIVAWLAGIPRRIGYDRKLGFLLTERVPHLKQEGALHETEYALDLARHIGIGAGSAPLYVPVSADNKAWELNILGQEGITRHDTVVAVHPAASCPSKIWPVERFAAVADVLSKKHGCKIVIVSGARDRGHAAFVERNMRQPVVNLAGRTTVGQLAAVLQRCRLFISNDSGPVHIASAVGTPVISIFGRSQAGLSPRRWGPRGPRDRVLHKSVGCISCRAHACEKSFACLDAISVEDVVRAADEILLSRP